MQNPRNPFAGSTRRVCVYVCTHFFSRTKDLDTVLERLKLLVAGLAGAAPKDQLGIQPPGPGQAPGGSDLVVDERVVVLEVGAEALEPEGGPEEQLLHAGALGGPGGEAVGVRWERDLHALDDVVVLEEEDGAGGPLEHGHAVLGVLPLVVGDDGAQRRRRHVPELVVLGAQEHDGAVGLRVEGRGRVEGGFVDELLNAAGGDGEVLVQRVDGAAGLGHLDEEVGGELGGRHFYFYSYFFWFLLLYQGIEEAG